MSNAIQNIADKMLYKWMDAVREPVKMVRIVINSGDESMLEAFYDYMLALDSEEEDMVFIIDLPFSSPALFTREIVEYVANQIEYWNTSDKPEDIIFEHINWKPNYVLETAGNEASFAVSNFNKLTEAMVAGTDMKCSFVFNLKNTLDYHECRKWFEKALELPFHKQMVWGISDIKEYEVFSKLMSRFPDETLSIYPVIDLDSAMEQLAEQAANQDKNDPAASAFRLAMIKLVNSVKKKDETQIEEYAKECLDIALANVKKDINWISQFVTVYTILYTDQLARKNYHHAMYFVDKAVEAAEIGEKSLDPSLGCRLLGNTLTGKASIYLRQSKWEEAATTYKEGAGVYAKCNDYLMQSEALRMSGWCWEKLHETSRATECYAEGFSLANRLSVELIKNSSYPLLLLSLLNSPVRAKYVSDTDLNSVLSEVIGKDWENYLYEYKRHLGKYNGMAEQDIS